MANKKTPYKFDPITMAAIGAGASAVGGIVDIFAGSAAKRAARDAIKAREAEVAKSRKAYEQFDFSVQNPFEDIDVSTEAQRLAGEQRAQRSADIMAQLGGGATGAGVAALATSMARQAATETQQIAAQTEQQEFALQQQRAQAQLNIDKATKAAEAERIATLYGIDMQRLAGAETQLAQAQEQIMGGVGAIAGGVTDFASDSLKYDIFNTGVESKENKKKEGE